MEVMRCGQKKHIAIVENNNGGGLLIFDVSNDNEIKGLSNAERNTEIISEQIKTRLELILEFYLSCCKMEDDKKSILLNISLGEEMPESVKAGATVYAFSK